MSQVVRRSAAILRTLQGHPRGLSVGAIAVEVDLPRSTVHRLLKSLEAEHLVAGASGNGGFRLGPALIHLSTTASAWLVDATHRHLAELSSETSETVDLAVLSGNRVHFVDHVKGPHPLQAVSEVGLAFPLHCTANGKALLAAMSDEHVANLLGPTLEHLTPNTLTTLPELFAELERVRTRNVAIDQEEHNLGISAVGTRLDNPYGLGVALSIPVPTSRFSERETELVEALMRTRRRVEEHIRTATST